MKKTIINGHVETPSPQSTSSVFYSLGKKDERLTVSLDERIERESLRLAWVRQDERNSLVHPISRSPSPLFFSSSMSRLEPPFTADEVALLRTYLEEYYLRTNDLAEKRMIDNLRDKHGSTNIMAFPVRLRQDDRAYEYDLLIEMINEGRNFAPLSLEEFTEADLLPDLEKIKLLNEYLLEARQLQTLIAHCK